jgi:hypothetical protein
MHPSLSSRTDAEAGKIGWRRIGTLAHCAAEHAEWVLRFVFRAQHDERIKFEG